jgi:protein TonB
VSVDSLHGVAGQGEDPRSGMPPSGLPPANDRMLTTCFLAALLHAIVILGVTFSASEEAASGGAPGLEVILVNDQAPRSAQNPTAHYLAERNQHGSGNTLEQAHALIPRSSPAPVERAGVAGGDGLAPSQTASDAGDEPALSTTRAAPRILYFASSTNTPATAAAAMSAGLPQLLEKGPDVGMSANDEGILLRLRGVPKHDLWVAADTRESDVAVYIDAWRRKVERVGTVNFPDAARRQNLSGTPVVEVTIAANGRLAQAIVRQSSGHPEIDEAALRILHLAAPFDPFPRALSAKHDEIRIAYEWQFLDGALQGSSVRYK